MRSFARQVTEMDGSSTWTRDGLADEEAIEAIWVGSFHFLS